MKRACTATFTQAFDFYARFAKEHLKGKTYREVLGLRNRYLKHLDKRHLSTIKRIELQELHSSIGSKAGKTAANRTIELISVIFNRAIDFDLFTGANPALRIQKYRLKSRERYLLPHEVAPFFSAVDSCKSRTVRDFIYMCIYTAARSGNVMQMRWSEINFDDAVWFVAETKNGESQYIPLDPEAISLLKSRWASRLTSDFVFPSKDQGHITNPRKTWYDILRRAQIADLRIHDLRRSHASWQLRAGVKIDVIGKTLNHKDIRSTLIYARQDYEPVRIAMNCAIKALITSGMTKRTA